VLLTVIVTSSTTECTCKTQVKPAQMIVLYSKIFNCDASDAASA
jgi:hypothetical protein